MPGAESSASPDLDAATLLAGFALGDPLQNPKAGLGQIPLGGPTRRKSALVGYDPPESQYQGTDGVNSTGGPPPVADATAAAAAVQEAMVMVQREQVIIASQEVFGKRARASSKESALKNRKRVGGGQATSSSEPTNVRVHPPPEQMLPRAPIEDPQMRQEIQHLPHLPQVSILVVPSTRTP